MIDMDNALNALRIDFGRIARLEQERQELLNSPLNPAMKDEREQDLRSDIERQRQRLLKLLRELVDFPPHHARHEQVLPQFHQAANYDKSVFVMTKFPNVQNPGPEDARLTAVIDAVRAAVTARGYTPRVASDQQYHPILWDNVELYLLGSQRAIAIVEDKYLPELNPNVAMEWGWMRGMGRNVLYLIEKDFQRQRADWGGLIERQFDWGAPQPGITAAIDDWLK